MKGLPVTNALAYLVSLSMTMKKIITLAPEQNVPSQLGHRVRADDASQRRPQLRQEGRKGSADVRHRRRHGPGRNFALLPDATGEGRAHSDRRATGVSRLADSNSPRLKNNKKRQTNAAKVCAEWRLESRVPKKPKKWF